MPNTNSWLCTYAIAQLGRPYWYACSGQISTPELYASRVKPNYTYNNYMDQLGVKVHDCSGLILGALTCDDVNGVPNGSAPVDHSATSQYNKSCSPKGSMSTFPKTPGTLVFHTEGSKKKHVGIYVGSFTDLDGKSYTDAVVEAMGHNWGVTTTQVTNNKWDCWGQLKFCERDVNSNTHFDARVILGTNEVVTQSSETININTENLRPYIATVIGESDIKIDYKKLADAKVSAMMFYGGQMYDAQHRKLTHYINPSLATQVQRCNDAGMPYGLYVNVRATSVIEADAECRALYYIISRYPPQLGIWLTTHFGDNTSLNNSILDVYYKYIYKWGLGARCGLYINKAQLDKISWGSYNQKFYLWLVDHMKADEIADLLDPDTFEVEET